MDYEQLAKMLTYNPETGELFWKEGFEHRYSGEKAGHLHDKNIGYIKVKHKNKRYMAHRLAWTIYYNEQPKGILDHIDGDRRNNRISNLRTVTQSENLRNQSPNKNNKSGFVGVLKTSHNTYTVTCLQKRYGSYKTFEEAVRVRLAAEQEIGGFTERHGKR